MNWRRKAVSTFSHTSRDFIRNRRLPLRSRVPNRKTSPGVKLMSVPRRCSAKPLILTCGKRSAFSRVRRFSRPIYQSRHHCRLRLILLRVDTGQILERKAFSIGSGRSMGGISRNGAEKKRNCRRPKKPEKNQRLKLLHWKSRSRTWKRISFARQILAGNWNV